MRFLDRLREYLEQVAHVPAERVIQLDHAALLRYFLAERDRLEPSAQGAERDVADRIQQCFRPFCQHLAALLVEHLLPGASAEELSELLRLALSATVDQRSAATSSYSDREVLRLAMNALTQAETEAKSEDPKPEQYALEIQAVRRAGDRMVITRSGSTFLGLRGLDAVRWLLTLEAAQTQGPRDEWRISQELAAQLITVPSGGLTYYQDEFGDVVSEPPVWNFSTSAFERLDLMGILTYTPRPPEWGGGFSYEVFKSSRPLLEEIANGHPTPFAVLAAALLRDENAQILDALRLNVNQTLPDGAAEATALQARMVAHEIRNALIPSQLALSRLASDLGDSASSEPFQRSRARVEAGLLRALQFADEMLRVANLGVEPSTSFDVMAAVRDAVAGVSSELNGSLQLTVPQEPALVSGPRARFVLAVTNLLRNAAQAVHAAPPSSGKAGTVALAIEVREQEVAIHVDDDGPGVPPEQRRAIFEQGIALRPGGSGQGLSMVRQVVEGEMQGAVSCGGSPLGGARFEIVVPTKKAQSR